MYQYVDIFVHEDQIIICICTTLAFCNFVVTMYLFQTLKFSACDITFPPLRTVQRYLIVIIFYTAIIYLSTHKLMHQITVYSQLVMYHCSAFDCVRTNSAIPCHWIFKLDIIDWIYRFFRSCYISEQF